MAFAPQWRGPQGNAQRVEFFLPLFGHENSTIHELAYLELARAPYGTIKRLARAVPRESIEPILRNPIYIEWRPLAILLLAQSPEATDKQYILESFRSAERIGLTRNLAAWAAAAIEVQGADAVSFIQGCYFRDPDRKRDELVEIVKAMSLHGTEGRTELRDQIVSAYDVLLDAHPHMMEYIVKDLIAWKRPELTQRISKHRGQGRAGSRCEESHSSVFGVDGVRPMTIGTAGASQLDHEWDGLAIRPANRDGLQSVLRWDGCNAGPGKRE